MRLYIDTDSGSLVYSTTENSTVAPPNLYNDDAIPVELHFLTRTGELDPYYGYVDVSGYTSIKIGVGTPGSTPLATCDTWAAPTVTLVVTERIKGTSGTNEVQRVTLTPAPGGGTFTLTFGGHTTSALSWDAAAATLKPRLRRLHPSARATAQSRKAPTLCTTWSSRARSPRPTLRL